MSCLPPVKLPEKFAPRENFQPPAGRWNALVEAVASLRPHVQIGDPRSRARHPWKVDLSPGEGRFEVRVEAGCVNDRAACIAWAVKDDPRGPMPEASMEVWREAREAAPESIFLATHYDRPLYEAEPPFLVLPDKPDAPGSPWRAGTTPPKALREASPEDAKFYSAGVVLAAFPYNTYGSRTPSALPRRFRVYAGEPSPAALRSALAGEKLEVARLWAAVADGEVAGTAVVQRVFWNLSCMAVEPDLQIPGSQAVTPVLPPLIGMPVGSSYEQIQIDAVNAALSQIEADIDSIEYWTT